MTRKLVTLITALAVVLSMTSVSYADTETAGAADTETNIVTNETAAETGEVIEEDTKEEKGEDTEEVNEEDISIHIGESFTLASGNWTSSDKKIAIIKNGKIVGVSSGNCIVTNGEYTYNVTVNKRVYKRSSKYYSITQNIQLPSGGYSLSTKNIGLKVIKVNRKLLESYSERYTNKTKQAVKNFQKKKGLKVTGVVNKKTWLKMGLSENQWYNLGTYVTPIKINGSRTKSDYINAMLKTAEEYAKAGTKYKVGCSGKPGTYADCSGLIYQCLYAAGINPDTNIVDHALAKYEYTSRWLAKDKKLGISVSYSNKKKGDLIFYGNPVYHVAIYAGGGYVYDSWPLIGVTKRKFNRPVSKVIRVFW